MIRLAYGDDLESIANFIKSITKEYSPDEIYRLDGENITKSDVISISDSIGLFSSKRLLILTLKTLSSFPLNRDLMLQLDKKEGFEMLIDCSSLTKTVGIKDKDFFKGIVKFNTFTLKKDFKSFDIADALIVNKDLSKAIKLVNSIDDFEKDIFVIMGAIQFDLRALIIHKNPESNLHAFVVSKMSKSKIDIDKAKEIYANLAILDAKIKRHDSSGMKTLFLDFLIENFS